MRLPERAESAAGRVAAGLPVPPDHKRQKGDPQAVFQNADEQSFAHVPILEPECRLVGGPRRRQSFCILLGIRNAVQRGLRRTREQASLTGPPPLGYKPECPKSLETLLHREALVSTRRSIS